MQTMWGPGIDGSGRCLAHEKDVIGFSINHVLKLPKRLKYLPIFLRRLGELHKIRDQSLYVDLSPNRTHSFLIPEIPILHNFSGALQHALLHRNLLSDDVINELALIMKFYHSPSRLQPSKGFRFSCCWWRRLPTALVNFALFNKIVCFRSIFVSVYEVKMDWRHLATKIMTIFYAAFLWSDDIECQQ